MRTASVSNLMTPPVDLYPAVGEASTTHTDAAESTEGWSKVLDERLIEWATHPEDFDDEGVIVPSRETIALAFQYVVRPFKENNRVPPSQVVPDTHGGIVFERRANSIFESIRVRADGHIEYCLLRNGKLVDRQMWR